MTKMNDVKVTKKDNFAALRECVLNTNWFDVEDAERIVEFIDHEIEQLDKRAASAKKYAKKNEKASDELTEACVTVLSTAEQPLTIPEIVALIDESMVPTPQKLTYRLNKLVELGTIKRDQITKKEEGKPSRKVNTYALN